MASDQIEERPGFSDLLAELNDSDVVIEVTAGSGMRRPPEAESDSAVAGRRGGFLPGAGRTGQGTA